MNQLSLLDPPRARRHDPETSKAAARMAEKFQRGHHRQILDYLDGIAPWSAHYIQIATATGLDKHAVGRRIKELKDADLIAQGPDGNLPNGNVARSWRVV